MNPRDDDPDQDPRQPAGPARPAPSPSSSPGEDGERNALAAHPIPWERNPSRWSQRITICLIALPAFLLAVYMALYQWGLIDSVYDPIFGEQSQQVLESDVSHRMTKLLRMPDAAFGALAYLGDIIFALAGSTRRWQHRPWLVIIFGIDVIPLGIVSAVLVFLQGSVVGAWCTPCLITAVISLVLVVLAADEVWSSLLYLWGVWKRTRSPRTVWRAVCGTPSEAAHAAGRAMTERWRERARRRDREREPVTAH